ncbi:hypothetical protein ACLB2K_001147 [Fragaria x ananassa]
MVPKQKAALLQGRFAGRKAEIVKVFDDGTRDRLYGHCLVAGIAEYLSKHVMSTRYSLDVDLKEVATVAHCSHATRR